MKRGLTILLALVFGVGLFAATPAMALTKTADFTLSESYITVGESFSVDVSVYDDGTLGDLTAFGFDVDPSASLSYISYDGYTIGADFDDVGANDSFYTGPVNYVAGLYWGTGNAAIDVMLATLNFTANAAGTDVLNILGTFAGFYGLFYEDDFSIDGTSIEGSQVITVNAAAPVPEPATMALLGLGIAGIGAMSRRRRRQ